MLLVESEWEPLQRLDRSVADSLNDVARDDSSLVRTLDVVAVVFDPWGFRVVVLAVTIWLWQRGARRLAVWAAVTMAVGGILGVLLKLLVERARPAFPEPVAHASGYSFPSGHALNSLLAVGVLILIFLPVLRGGRRLLVCLVGATIVIVTGYDRVALGVHFVSDVVAGWVVAIAVLVGTYTGFEVWRREVGFWPSPIGEGVDPDAVGQLDSSTEGATKAPDRSP
jgi:undecaprenyl-diphosphatase